MMYGGDGWMWGSGWGWGGWMLMWIVMVILIAVAISVIVLAIRHLSGGSSAPPVRAGQGPGRAEDMLAQRFARGEIDEDEYRRRMTVLREHQ